MRLINTETLEFEEFYEERIPRYAILSHRWEAEEVTFEDYPRQLGLHRADRAAKNQSKGFRKIGSFRSSAELSEAINSMFQWYAKATVCYAYLCDVRSPESCVWGEVMADLGGSVWFTRGWTLQELLAPESVKFLSKDWTPIGLKGPWLETPSKARSMILDDYRNDRETLSYSFRDLTPRLDEITGISKDVLNNQDILSDVCVAEKMLWAGRRKTARSEDIAYSLLGLFDVNMPLLYGEGGEKAFVRLQQEIMRKSTDQSIYAWPRRYLSLDRDIPGSSFYDGWKGLLAPSPSRFLRIETIEVEPTCCSYGEDDGVIALHEEINPSKASFTMTARGMQVEIDAFPLSEQLCPGTSVAPLNCGTSKGRCVIFFQEIEDGMALKGDANYPFLLRVLSIIDPGFITFAKIRPKSFCVQQTGFNDMRLGGRGRLGS